MPARRPAGSDLATALLKLHEDNAATLTPDPVYVRFYYSHPPAVGAPGGLSLGRCPHDGAGPAALPAANRRCAGRMARCQRLLAEVPGWVMADGAFEKTFELQRLPRTAGFVNAVGWIAHSEDHHPELPSAGTAARCAGTRTRWAACRSTTSSAPPRSTPCCLESRPPSARGPPAGGPRPMLDVGLVVGAHGRHASSRRPRASGCCATCAARRATGGRRPRALAARGRRRRHRAARAAPQPAVPAGRLAHQVLRGQPRPAADDGGGGAAVQRVAADARADRGRGRGHTGDHRPEQGRPAGAAALCAQRLAPYLSMGVEVLEMAVKAEPDAALACCGRGWQAAPR
jgi:hypothetical protein